jgi:hypothetical protein
MTSTIEAPEIYRAEAGAPHPHRVIFSDPEALKATPVRDLDTLSPSQAPEFSFPD